MLVQSCNQSYYNAYALRLSRVEVTSDSGVELVLHKAANIKLWREIVLYRYPIMLPVKGSFVWWCPRQIAITTNIHPKDWYNYNGREEQYRALSRRIHQVLTFDVKKEEGGWEPVRADPEFWYDRCDNYDYMPADPRLHKCYSYGIAYVGIGRCFEFTLYCTIFSSLSGEVYF
ncbi:hypothetical protein LCGC14_3167690 [marine sediment metagenome]|uniref:Uncharacterized protein n=1 Tax=marine sediment metagenome TaxID=412755 RepID=A0A0F8XPG0_9ZZZZ